MPDEWAGQEQTGNPLTFLQIAPNPQGLSEHGLSDLGLGLQTYLIERYFSTSGQMKPKNCIDEWILHRLLLLHSFLNNPLTFNPRQILFNTDFNNEFGFETQTERSVLSNLALLIMITWSAGHSTFKYSFSHASKKNLNQFFKSPLLKIQSKPIIKKKVEKNFREKKELK